LRHVSETSKKKWYNDAIYRDVWDQEHDILLQDIHTKVSAHVDSWLQSPAGIEYKTRLNASVLDKHGKLPLVTAQEISELAQEGSNPRQGIQWTVQEVFDIFSFLATVAEVKTIQKTTPEVVSPRQFWGNANGI
jgi:hypothetical protein